MGALTVHEAAIWWRTLDAPHAAEDIDAGTVASIRPTLPRGSSGMYCCGTNWGTREEADIHRSSIHH